MEKDKSEDLRQIRTGIEQHWAKPNGQAGERKSRDRVGD
jgi:hypothetical protein